MGDCERAMDAFRTRDPGHVHLQSYEALQRDAEGAIRALLDACGLPFDPACLQFQDARRSVRTASAAQVRQPLQAGTGRTRGYRPLPDPLRAAPAAVALAWLPPAPLVVFLPWRGAPPQRPYGILRIPLSWRPGAT